ncbi:MAG: hypothetical protein ABII82_11045 [Verrucomicrobiota bacterium]
MKTTKTSTATYLVTFAAIVALPFAALHAGGDSDQQNSAAHPTAPATRVGANAENPGNTPATDGQNVDTRHNAADVRNDSTYTGPSHRADDAPVASDNTRDRSTDRGDVIVTTGPEVDGSSRSANGIARAPNELKAEALDIATGQRQDRDGHVTIGHARVHEDDVAVTDGTYGKPGTRADLNHKDAVEMQLNTRATTDNIESTGFENRDLAITMAESGLTEGKQIVLALRSSGSTTTPEARKDLDQAIRKVEQAEQKLTGAITSGRSASESRWDTAREELADRYEDYAEALENAREVAVDGGVHFQSQASADSAPPANRS